MQVCDLTRNYVFIMHFYHHFEFLYLEPDDGPKGPKYVACMKINTCVTRYLTFVF